MNAPTTHAERVALSPADRIFPVVMTWQEKLQFVGKAWQDCNPICETCPHAYFGGQMLPYGESKAFEAYSECRLVGAPECCPALAEHLQQLTEQETE